MSDFEATTYISIFDFEVERSDFEVEPESTYNVDGVRFFYLKPQNVESIYNDLRNGWSGNGRQEPIAEPTAEDVYNFLYRHYLQKGVGEDYGNLSRVTALLGQSNNLAVTK